MYKSIYLKVIIIKYGFYVEKLKFLFIMIDKIVFDGKDKD